MKVLVYLLVPVLVVAAWAMVSWARNRQPTSLDSGIDAFQREMRALSPDAAPLHRRRGPSSSTPATPPAEATATNAPTGPPGAPPGSRPTAGPARPPRQPQPSAAPASTPRAPRRPPTPDRRD